MRFKDLALVALATCVIALGASAPAYGYRWHHHWHHHGWHHLRRGANAPSTWEYSNYFNRQDGHGGASAPRSWFTPQSESARTTYGRVIGGRPSGCPYAFCGCEASLFIFGHIVDALNLAANWLHFPHVAPAPGMAAVAPSRHHVLVLERHVAGPYWVVHDGNSGRHLTREHVRNIAGFTVVNPHVGRG